MPPVPATRSFSVTITLCPAPLPSADLNTYRAAMSQSAEARLMQELITDIQYAGGPWTFPGIIASDFSDAARQAAAVVNAARQPEQLEPVAGAVRWIPSGHLHLIFGRSLADSNPGAANQVRTAEFNQNGQNFRIPYEVLARYEIA